MLKLDGPGLVVRRYPDMDDDPDLTQVGIAATDGRSALNVEFYLSASRFGEIGKALVHFPRAAGDSWETTFGSDDPQSAQFFAFRVFTWGAKADCALGLKAVCNADEVGSSRVEFAIATEAAAVNTLGRLLIDFARLQYVDLHWSPMHGGALFEEERRDLAR